ncbi:hypothetical protein [Glutamicibacter sp. TV12E]|uniref:hypothetical protein n=1 Tax=Glutamicibacter sp. TV12E TaxID=3446362 RepID=UPI0040336552
MKEAAFTLWASTVRTIVPIVVGAVLGWFTAVNVTVDPEFEKALAALLTLLLTTVFYVLVRLVETYVSPKFGWLLGYAKSPDSYSKASPAASTKAAGGSFPGYDGHTRKK